MKQAVILILVIWGLAACQLDQEFQLDLEDPERSVAHEDFDSGGTNPNQSPVVENNTAPTISAELTHIIQSGDHYFAKLDIDDAENDPLTFTIKNFPLWLIFDSEKLEIHGEPISSSIELYENISIVVSDGELSSELGPFSIVVLNHSEKLKIGGNPDVIINENETYLFQPEVINDSQNSLSYTVINKPSWATFNSANGSLSGTPDYFDAGLYSNILISVSDGINYSAISPFQISVVNQNRPPIIEQQDITVDEDSSVEFFVVTSDPDNDSISTSIEGLPQNGNLELIDASTNKFLYTPTPNFSGNDAFLLRVDDSFGARSRSRFSITVNPSNDIPIAYADSVTVLNGSSNSIDVLANDRGLGDGNVTLEIVSQPNQGNATITENGTIQYESVNNFSSSDNLVYSVTDSDGQTTYAFVNININNDCLVNCTGPITYTWVHSVTPDIFGYYVYYGRRSGVYENIFWVGDVDFFVHEIETSGSHYFALKTVSVDGRFSDFSEESKYVF